MIDFFPFIMAVLIFAGQNSIIQTPNVLFTFEIVFAPV